MIGAGYVGLPTAATLAHFGTTSCWRTRASRLAALRSGRMPIVEAGLASWWPSAVGAGQPVLRRVGRRRGGGPEFVFLCVPTPQSADGSADLSYVEAAAKEIGSHLVQGAIVVNKSTVPVGSATMVEQVIGRPDISVVSNPEFLREGSAVLDSLQPGPDRRRGRRRPGGGQGGRALHLDRGPAHRDRRHDVGDDQVRVERVLGH